MTHITKVYISPHISAIADDNGVGKVVHAQYRYLNVADYGIELVGSPDEADIVAAHINADGLPRVDVLHVHGLYWDGDKNSGQYSSWHRTSNAKTIEAARQAYAVSVPSEWVAMPFRRDMRIEPVVIGHGVEIDEWLHTRASKGYGLWNKNRDGDVCDTDPVVYLAERGVDMLTTFVRKGTPIPGNLRICGRLPHDEMKVLIQEAAFYLATTKETYGIGTLEALASGVPVLGYDWGGTADIVTHLVTGYLAKPGDLEDLYQGYLWITEHTDEVKANITRMGVVSWAYAMQQYARLYHRVAEQKRTQATGVSVVITSYNYARYLQGAIDSVHANQSVKPIEIIIVDDGSTDNTSAIARDNVQGSIAIRDTWDDFKGFMPTFRLITQKNQGVAAARNAGIAAASQPYIVCLDADDELDPRFIQTLLPVMQRDRGLGIAYSGLMLLWEDGRETLSPFPPAFDWEKQASPGNPPPTCIPSGAMFRRDMWERAGGYQQIWAPGEDTEFWTRGLSVGFRAAKVTDEPLFRYRLHEGQAHKTKQYKPIDVWHPWIRDRQYPMGAPALTQPLVRSYSEPLISVIIPVGPGHIQYLPSALDSLLGQTFRNWEVIVVFDTPEFKPGNEPALLAPYPFMRIYGTAGNQGVAKARNWGLEHARGRFTVFLDADDYLMPTALEKMLAAFISSGGKYIYTDWLALWGDKHEPHETPEYVASAWLEKGQHAVTALILTSDARGVGGFDEALKGWEDWDFFIKVALSGICGQRLSDILLGYRMHSGTQREVSLANKTDLLDIFKRRYGAFIIGEKTMPGCCGGNGDAIIQAKNELAPGYQPPIAPAGPVETAGVLPEGVVRLVFVGPEQGTLTFRSADGQRTYRGGNNQHDKFCNVLERDVAHLLLFPQWQRVGNGGPIQPPIAQALPTVQPAPLPPAQPRAPIFDPPVDIPTENLNPWGVDLTPSLDPEAEKAANVAVVEALKKQRRAEKP